MNRDITIKFAHFNNLIYPWLTITTAVLLLSEIIWPGFVRPYLNLDLWLLFWSASVILKLVLSTEISFFTSKAMINDVVLKRLKIYEDDRGWLAEIYRDDEDHYQPVMSYISVTNPGIVRGPHEHNHQADCFVFIGPGDFELHLWDRRENSPTNGQYVKEVVGQSNPMMVIVPAGVVHGYKAIGDQAAWSINLPDKLYRGVDKAEEVDEIRWEQNPESPYKIA